MQATVVRPGSVIRKVRTCSMISLWGDRPLQDRCLGHSHFRICSRQSQRWAIPRTSRSFTTSPGDVTADSVKMRSWIVGASSISTDVWPYQPQFYRCGEQWVQFSQMLPSVMRRIRIWITLGSCFFALTVFVWAQGRKAGLWELTTTQTWQQSPLPPGISAPPGGANSPFGTSTRTTKVCLTQEQLDKYGAIVPQTRGCQVTNVVKKGNSMTANMECTGAMSGKGTLESTSIDDEHAKGKVHFIGSLRMGPNTKPVEWTVQSSSVFKSADCGDVKPASVPDK
jgi:Protein of unknown function (DUF3617)